MAALVVSTPQVCLASGLLSILADAAFQSASLPADKILGQLTHRRTITTKENVPWHEISFALVGSH